MTERNSQDLIQRGQQAKMLLDNETLKEALQTLKDDLIHAWSNSPMDHQQQREQLWYQYLACQRFESLLTGYIQTGKFEVDQAVRKDVFFDHIKSRQQI